uniref:Ig-like domain-containing protein n=1 Tax=Gopherus agassizii TaxID=38772 RepID=A0A452J6Z5_9SAUR
LQQGCFLKPGSSITLDCVVSGYNINDHHLHWVRQAPGKGLVWVTAFRTGFTTFTANEFKGRVTPSTSGSTARLKIDRLTAADTATYYCARETQCSLPSFLSYSNLWGKGFVSLTTSLCMKFSPLPQPVITGPMRQWSPTSVLRVRVPWGTSRVLLPLQRVEFYPEIFRALVSAILMSGLQIKSGSESSTVCWLLHCTGNQESLVLFLAVTLIYNVKSSH